MKHNPNPNRGRPRGNGKRNPSSKNQSFESTGSDNKIRGTAQQLLDKYLALGRDAYSSGDRVASENYFQYADHYYRIVNANNEAEGQSGQGQQGQQNQQSQQGQQGQGRDRDQGRAGRENRGGSDKPPHGQASDQTANPPAPDCQPVAAKAEPKQE